MPAGGWFNPALSGSLAVSALVGGCCSSPCSLLSLSWLLCVSAGRKAWPAQPDLTQATQTLMCVAGLSGLAHTQPRLPCSPKHGRASSGYLSGEFYVLAWFGLSLPLLPSSPCKPAGTEVPQRQANNSHIESPPGLILFCSGGLYPGLMWPTLHSNTHKRVLQTSPSRHAPKP